MEEKNITIELEKTVKPTGEKTVRPVTEKQDEKVTAVSSQKLLVSGAHFGHQTKRWNPKMRKFIYTAKKGVHIINLSKTIVRTQVAYDFMKSLSEKGGDVIFIGTKKQAKIAIKEQAERCGAFYVSERWLGGTLTNFKTIKNRFRRMSDIERMEKEGTFALLSKKEVILLQKEFAKLENLLSGIRYMRYMPKAIFVIDPVAEMNAVLEAKKLGIPVVAVVDTNCDPDIINFPIPGNDDANKAVELFVTLMADAINEGKGVKPVVAYTKDEPIEYNRGPRKEFNRDSRGPRRDGERKPHVRDGERKPYVRDGERKPHVRDGERKPHVRDGERKPYVRDGERKPYVRDGERKPFVKREDRKPFEKIENTSNLVKETKVAVVKEETQVSSTETNFSTMKLTDLKALAKESGYKGYSTLKKDELASFIQNGGK